MRYRLRTLLILLAVGPPLIYYVVELRADAIGVAACLGLVAYATWAAVTRPLSPPN